MFRLCIHCVSFQKRTRSKVILLSTLIFSALLHVSFILSSYSVKVMFGTCISTQNWLAYLGDFFKGCAAKNRITFFKCLNTYFKYCIVLPVPTDSGF